MVTVVDPLGTPVPVYNRSGTVVLVPLHAGSEMSPTEIPSLAGVTIATLVAEVPAGFLRHYRLPSVGVEVGDVIELYGVGFSGSILPPDGEAYLDGTTGAITLSNSRNSAMFRRVDSTHWAILLSL